MQKLALYRAGRNNSYKSSYLLASVSRSNIERAMTHTKGTTFLVWSTVERTRNSTFSDTEEIWGAY